MTAGVARHTLKVLPPYMDALEDGSKTFEVRRNDRAFQRGDVLLMREWHPTLHDDPACVACRNRRREHFTGRDVTRVVTFVYSGDPRFGGIEPGHVVLAIAPEAQR